MKTIQNLLFAFSIVLFFNINFTVELNAQSWSQLNDSPFYRHHSNGFGIGDKAYVFEGGISGSISDNVWEYIAETDTWNEIAEFPGADRGFAIGDDWNGKYYYGFGTGEGGRLRDVWVFDPSDLSFVELPSCPCEARTHPAFIAHNDKIYIGAGSGANGNLGDWWVLDLITMEWSQKDDIPGDNRHHPFQFTIEDKIYVGGGHRENWEVYDPELETWSPIDNLPRGRVAGSQFSYRNYGFVLGGDNASHDHVPNNESFMYYDAENDKWTKLPELPIGSKWANSSFVIGDNVYFFGGVKYGTNDETSMWKFDLRAVDCAPPANLAAINLTDTYAQLFWNSNSDKLADTLQWRKVGDPTWNVIVNATPIEELDGLEECTDYEFQIASECETTTSYSEVTPFKTDGCCMNPELSVENLSKNEALLNWNSVLAAIEFTVRWRAEGTTEWETTMTNELNHQIEDLEECQLYEFQISTSCDGEEISFSESFIFRTQGCGACLDETYCSIKEVLSGGNEGYIRSVQIGDYMNVTGDDSGYGDFAIPESEEFTIGESFDLTVVTTFDFLNLKVWIDYNANGVFDDNELVGAEASAAGTEMFNINIPSATVEGLTRMRIAYTFSQNDLNPCINEGSGPYGEAEDYCITFKLPSSIKNDAFGNRSFSAYPTPATNSIKLKGDLEANKSYDLAIINLLGAQVIKNRSHKLDDNIDISALTSGTYIIILTDGTHTMKSKLIVE